MSGIATAIVGSAVVGGVVASNSASKAADASNRASALAADATVQSTEMQIQEISRQFDTQMRLLVPRVNKQLLATNAFSNLMGINDMVGETQQFEFKHGLLHHPEPGTKYAIGGEDAGPSTNFNQSGPNQNFMDPNLDNRRLVDSQRLPGQIQSSLLAGTNAESDEFINYINQNRLTADTLQDDARFRRSQDVTAAGGTLADDTYYGDVASRSVADGAAGTGVYGEEFEASPGYAFAVEEMNRSIDRKNSAGGNYGGDAIREAMRQAKGLANQEYYNWASGRTSDLQRKAQGEAFDASRLDSASQNYVNRQLIDINRGDAAVDSYEQSRVSDIARDDQAQLNYLARKTQDTQRLDSATAETDRLDASDLARSDQSYYNYLSNLARVAGFADSTAQAASAAGAAGAQASNAYANEGSQLSSNYLNQGNNLANIALNKGANINNALQSGVSNYLTFSLLK